MPTAAAYGIRELKLQNLSHYPAISLSGTNLLTLDTGDHQAYAIRSEVYKLPISLNVQCLRFHDMDLTYCGVV